MSVPNEYEYIPTQVEGHMHKYYTYHSKTNSLKIFAGFMYISHVFLGIYCIFIGL